MLGRAAAKCLAISVIKLMEQSESGTLKSGQTWKDFSHTKKLSNVV